MSHNVSTYSQKSFTLLLPGNKVALQEIFKTQKALKCSAKGYKRVSSWTKQSQVFSPFSWCVNANQKTFSGWILAQFG